MKTIRQDLHKIPELGFKEYKTKEYIKQRLVKKGQNVVEIGDTGLITYFDFKQEKTICFRAEMDALPIQEENDVEYKSVHNGCMHACGHDGHMAILLSIIDDLLEGKFDPDVNVLFLFQPSEEINGGSQSIIDSGVLKEYKVDEIYSLHIWPNLPKGEIYTRYNELLAKPTEFDIDIKGKASHIGNLIEGKDALYVGVSLCNSIYSEIKNVESSIVHIGQINSGNQRNIVSSYCNIKGTIRTFGEKTYNKVIEIINRNVNFYSLTHKITINLNINSSLDSIINDNDLVNKAKTFGVKLLKYPYYQGEDFSLYLKDIKGVYFLLGAGKIDPLHSSTFNFDEEILEKGKELFVNLIIGNKNSK